MTGTATRLLAGLSLLAVAAGPAAAAGDFHDWARTPPMGWNSWDCFATTLTDAQARAEADAMAERLAVHGWTYLVVDIQWYEPGATGFGYRANAALTLDGFGRLLPAPNKFPSAGAGRGFRPLADYVHGKNLKFGIHLMRGVPRQAVDQNLPILGTRYRAADIVDRAHVCPWNGDMYGVDMSKPGAQAYYDSVFALIASWGVDFVKVDDIARPYIRNEPEIEAVRRAVDRSGRAMVVSLSPGETDLHAAAHAAAHANMWRISDDFWDHWSLLESQFRRLDQWSRWRQPGAWPDADMLPIGTIEMGRQTWFTPTEEVTLMTLWCIARSPLMIGADLTKLDAATAALLTNDEVLRVNQDSANNRQLFRRPDGGIGWIADTPDGRDRYVALFNTRDPWVLRDASRLWRSEAVSIGTPGQSVSFDVPVKDLETVVLVADDAPSPRFWWPSVFREVRWRFGDGHELRADREYGSHGERINGLAVPRGAVALRGVCRLDDTARDNAKGEGLVFSAYGFASGDLRSKSEAVPLDLSTLGLGGTVRILDLWNHADLGRFSGTFSPEIEWHGARLYRVSAAAPQDPAKRSPDAERTGR
jgi:alpha-galactosidase